MGYNSYRIFKKQYSLDNGETWADVDPIVGEPKFVTSFDSLDECALDTYKAIFYYESGEVEYVPCDGDDTLRSSDSHKSGVASLVVVGNCVRVLNGVGRVRRVSLPPNGILERIDQGALEDCGLGYGVDNYTMFIPDTVTYIGSKAFDCSFVSNFDIGTGVTYIGSSCFSRGGGPGHDPCGRHFYFRGAVPPVFQESINPMGNMFQEACGTCSIIHVPCGSEYAYYEAIGPNGNANCARQTIYSTIPEECNWSAKFYTSCTDKNNPTKIPLRAGVQSSAYTSGITDVEIAERSDVRTINYNLNDSVLNKIEIPDTIRTIKLLSNFTTERLFTNKVSYLDYQGGVRNANIDYFEYGTEVPMTAKEDSLRVSGTTCRIGEYGSFGEYSGINLKFDNVILEFDRHLSLGGAFKNGKINNLYVLPSQLSNYSGQTQYYNHIYAIGEQTGTTWVPAKREYLHDAETGKYYYKEYERKDFENEMWYYTKNYRQGDEFVPEPYWVACDTIIVDEENGIDWNTEAKVFLFGDVVMPLYELRKTTPNKSYQFKYEWFDYYNNVRQEGVRKVECSGQTTLSSGLTSNSVEKVIVYDNCCTSIGDGAFRSQSWLTSISMPNTVTSIGNYAFRYCNHLANIDIPDSVTSIGDSAFSGCSSLTNIDIPDSVTSIGDSAFTYCSGLTSINIPSGLTSMGKYIFANCKNITSVNVPNSITYISDSAFRECNSLTSCTLGTGLTSIGNSAFVNCTSLTSIDIPDSVTSIGNSAFNSCSKLTNIVIPDGVTSISNYTFSRCSGLTSIVIPDSVTSIGQSAFYSCSRLTGIVIPDSVTYIGQDAFNSCISFTNIVIPDSVTTIGQWAFSSCVGLTSLTVEATTPPSLGSYAFYNTSCQILVPAESVELYKSTSGWSDYSSRIQAISV